MGLLRFGVLGALAALDGAGITACDQDNEPLTPIESIRQPSLRLMAVLIRGPSEEWYRQSK